MKKFYALAAALMMTATSFAQNGAPLYATGAGDFEYGEWSPETPSEFIYADGYYTLNVNNLTQFKLSTVKGDWNTFDSGAIGCNYGDEPDVWVTLEAYANNILAPWKGDYTITVAGDLSSIKLSTTTPAPTNTSIDLYLRGNMNAWGVDEVWKMTQVTGNIFQYIFPEGLSIPAGEEFKIADADWGKYNIGRFFTDEILVTNQDYEVFNGGSPLNMKFEEECHGVIWLILGLNEANYLWASNDKTAKPSWAPSEGALSDIVTEEAPARFINLQGVEVANPSNGMYIVVKGNHVYKTIIR